MAVRTELPADRSGGVQTQWIIASIVVFVALVGLVLLPFGVNMISHPGVCGTDPMSRNELCVRDRKDGRNILVKPIPNIGPFHGNSYDVQVRRHRIEGGVMTGIGLLTWGLVLVWLTRRIQGGWKASALRK